MPASVKKNEPAAPVQQIVGREDEQKTLTRLLQSGNAELLAVYGRRRVGKTWLIRTFFNDQMVFECSGEAGSTAFTQLMNFTARIEKHFRVYAPGPVQSWREAFLMLETGLDQLMAGKKKKVIFFDELPWLDTHKSGFLPAFGYWWNMYASRRSDLLVVICGSAASWMIEKVVNNRSGLHNRITRTIRLLPFTLGETAAYLKFRNINLDPYQILQLYMVFGGIPHYLNSIVPGQSAEQSIKAAFFTKGGELTNEFNNLYASLFTRPENHIQVVQLLAKQSAGLTRQQLLAGLKKHLSGGGITKVLNELAESGFIEKTAPFGKKTKEAFYRLSDEYSIFWLRFVNGKTTGMKEAKKMLQSESFRKWCGFAFEGVCMKHAEQIKQALGISGIYTENGSWIHKGSPRQKGAQVDLLIDRSDGCINLCEIKFSAAPFVITRKYAGELQEREHIFRMTTKTRKTVFTTFITPFGVADNEYRVQRVHSEVNLAGLFKT